MPVVGPCLQPGAVQQMARDQALRDLLADRGIQARYCSV